MAHHCEAALVCCEDFRLHHRPDGSDVVSEFLSALNVNCDVISRAGAIQDLVRPRQGFDGELIRDLDVSANLHQVADIYLMNHEDCGAYGAFFSFGSRAEEIAQHLTDLAAARRLLQERYPNIRIHTLFAELIEGSDDRFKLREVK
jgi:carbonic anhydrase